MAIAKAAIQCMRQFLRKFMTNSSGFLLCNEKRGLRPFLVSHAGFWPAKLYASAAFFLPMNLPINGQNKSNSASDEIPATK